MQLHIVQMTLLGGLFAGFACAGAQALPTEPAPAPGPTGAAAAAAPPATRVPATQQETTQVAGWGSPARQARLSGSRGGADTAIADARLNATVTNNTATNISTGANIIDNGSFANMNGLPMVIQNSGANVLIQNATIINLQLK